MWRWSRALPIGGRPGHTGGEELIPYEEDQSVRGPTEYLALAIQVDGADLSIVTWKCFGDPSQGPSALL